MFRSQTALMALFSPELHTSQGEPRGMGSTKYTTAATASQWLRPWCWMSKNIQHPAIIAPVYIPGLMTLWRVHLCIYKTPHSAAGSRKIAQLSCALGPVSGSLNEVWRRLQALPVVLGSTASQAQAKRQEETEGMVTSEDSTASSSRGSITLSSAPSTDTS